MAFGKGDRVRITGGKAEGVTGTVFWKGQNKYGPGDRYGVRGDDGQTHWVDGGSVEATKADVPTGHTFDKGDRVAYRVPGGEGTGTVFWVGQSRHGPGQRLGVRADHPDGEDDAVWIDGLAARPLDPGEDPGAPEPASRGRSNPYQGDRGRGAAASGGGWSGGEGADEMPSDYAAPMGMDEMPSAPPMDDASLDQLGEWVPEDQEPPADW